jgi:three-Cys-motif partner protein
MAVVPQEFGSGHTETKLRIVQKYLEAFTVALKKQGFRLIYVDAFAGSGASIPRSDAQQIRLIEADDIIDGSTRRALRVSPSFDEFLFIEKLGRNLESLAGLKEEFPDKNDRIVLLPGDANQKLREFATDLDKRNARAVVFIDPFGLSVEWDTIIALGQTEKVDLWYLVPTGGMSRQIKLDGTELEGAQLLDQLLGTTEWRMRVISNTTATDLFGNAVSSTSKIGGAGELSQFVQERLKTAFKGGVSKRALPLGRGGRHEFSLVFACANPSPKASLLALKLADAVLKA